MSSDWGNAWIWFRFGWHLIRVQAVAPYLVYPQIGTRLGFGWDLVGIWSESGQLSRTWCVLRLGPGWDLVGIWSGSGPLSRTWCILRLGSGRICLASSRVRTILPYLVYPQIGVRGDDGAAAEVHPFAAEVSPESALFSLQPLHQASRRLLRLETRGSLSQIQTS